MVTYKISLVILTNIWEFLMYCGLNTLYVFFHLIHQRFYEAGSLSPTYTGGKQPERVYWLCFKSPRGKAGHQTWMQESEPGPRPHLTAAILVLFHRLVAWCNSDRFNTIHTSRVPIRARAPLWKSRDILGDLEGSAWRSPTDFKMSTKATT